MRQLREWGWMHHLARHSVACFLTRGDLYISWEEGQAVFEELLIDAVRKAPWHLVRSLVGRMGLLFNTC
jgi:deoxyribodipyrimidine photolyase